MSDQVINQEFSTYYKLLSKEQKKSILFLLKSFIDRDNRVNIDQYNIEIDAAETRVSQGQFISHEELEKESKEW